MLEPTQVFQGGHGREPRTTVVVPLHDRGSLIEATLESVRAQTLADLDLIVVDDASTDGSLARAHAWMQAHASRFGRALLLSRPVNGGPGATRNDGVRQLRGPHYLALDDDNLLLPRCAERCLEALEASGAAAVYPLLASFGDPHAVIMGTHDWDPARLAHGNTIDALALIRVSAWQAVGGYRVSDLYGLEDYELWCGFVGQGLRAAQVPEILALYRRGKGTLRDLQLSETARARALHQAIRSRHPWMTR